MTSCAKRDGPNITVRNAKLEDCEAVINIDPDGEIYDGFDYLPQWIRPLTQDKASNGVVVECDGKIVAYVNYFVMENGTVACQMSGRVSERYRGQGLSKMAIEYIKQATAEKYPQLRTILYTTAYEELPMGDEFVLKENFLIQHSVVEGLRRNLNSQPLVQLGRSCQTLSPQAAVNLLADDTIMQKFFNHRYITAHVYMWPVRPTKDNMRNIALRHNVAASFDNVSVLSPQLPQEVTAISFSDIAQSVSKFSLMLFFHGNDINLLKDHILTHLRRAITVIKDGAIGLKLSFPLAMNNHRDEIDKFVKTVCGSPETRGRRFYIIGKQQPLIYQSKL